MDGVVEEASTAGKVISCKAAVVLAFGEAPTFEDIEVEPPQAGEVRIRIAYTTICHSDLHVWRQEAYRALYPRILGHEAAGVIESVGEGVTEFSPGDHVFPMFFGQCKNCAPCMSPKSNICSKFTVNPGRGTLRNDDTSRFSMKGQTVYHCYGSTFSQYTVVEQEYVVKINPKAELDKVVVLSCAAGTGMGAVWNSAKVEPKSTVAVFGLGSVGCCVGEGARVAGASRIIGVDVNSSKFEKAKPFGFTDFLNPNECTEPVDQVISRMTNGGVDYSFECVGNIKLMQTAFNSCTLMGGKTVVVGVTPSRACNMELAPYQLLYGKTITGSLYGGFRPSDVPELVERYMRHEFQLEPLITHKVPFAEFGQAWKLLLEGESLRTVISAW